MNAHDFLDVADELATGTREAHWRSAVSRAYYAAFHAARSLFEQCGFAVPDAERVHSYCRLRLMNSGHPDVALAGRWLDVLRTERNIADYELRRSVKHTDALRHVERAAEVVRLLEEAAALPTVVDQITVAMRTYERDVLRDVTWRGSLTCYEWIELRPVLFQAYPLQRVGRGAALLRPSGEPRTTVPGGDPLTGTIVADDMSDLR